MKVAIPQWQGRVSPVFDVADRALVVDVVESRERRREVMPIAGEGPVERAKWLRAPGVEVLICSAISRPMEMTLVSSGIRVVSGVCGGVEEVLQAYLCDQLDRAEFRLPGSKNA